MNHPAELPTCADDELHAYVDGQLPSHRRARVEAVLAVNPDLAARADWYRRLNVDLHATLDDEALKSLPPDLARLGRDLDANLRHQRFLHRVVRAAASLVVVAALAGLALWGSPRAPEPRLEAGRGDGVVESLLPDPVRQTGESPAARAEAPPADQRTTPPSPVPDAVDAEAAADI